ncbi:MAG: T9SS type A sorting domain-containing protein [Bacteroidia bacterium]|nr:T9SS type A sorting domain-containing protein [Bacteroidia bacterium]
MIKLKLNLKKVIYFTFFNLLAIIELSGQRYNHNWLIGYNSGLDTNVVTNNAILSFDANSINVAPTNFKMPFRAAQGNISDANGNLLMVSNGCWIADATLDTMQNGGGLNPNPFTSTWCDNVSGIPFPHSNVVLPFPEDSLKYVLFHQTGTDNVNTKASFLYYSVIDMNLNGGLGGVIAGQKNLVALQVGLNPGLAVCKHANGRDWWIIAFKDSSDIVYKFLLTPTGVSAPVMQSLGVPPTVYLLGQMLFSPDGKKMAYLYYDGVVGIANFTLRLFDFDRCNGMFSNTSVISFTENQPGLGLAFSNNSKYLYACTTRKIIQMNTDTSNITASMDTVAIYDGYAYPYPFLQTLFWTMYLAADGKIYITSGNSVIDMHYINHPDSAGIACDVQQHALPLPCYSGRGNVYHPNYYLGCDTTLGCPCLLTDVNELSPPDFKFRVYPSPVTNGVLHIGYLLPQNESGMFEVVDVTGKVVFKYPLPPWSNEQSLKLPQLANGVYNCVITSDDKRVSKKIAVMRE